MFYEQFSKITNLLNPEFVERFDCWLATLPSNNQKNITASSVAARLGVSYTQAEEILKYAERQKILEKEFLVKCPECDSEISKKVRICPECGYLFQQGLSEEQLTGYIEQEQEKEMSSEQIDRAFEKTDNIAADEIDSFDGDINDFLQE